MSSAYDGLHHWVSRPQLGRLILKTDQGFGWDVWGSPLQQVYQGAAEVSGCANFVGYLLLGAILGDEWKEGSGGGGEYGGDGGGGAKGVGCDVR